jgi:hypothetical protein
MKNISILFFLSSILFGQDTLTYQWPVTPFNSTQLITGAFCEYRNTLSSNHFHNGVDIPKADGSAVYPVLDGTITAIGYPATEGTSAYIRVEGTVNGIFKSTAYVHIEPNPALSPGQSVTKGVTILGNILSGMGHVHFIDGRYNSENNALRKAGGLSPFVDTYSPKVLTVKFYQDNSNVEFTTKKVSGLIDIVSQMVERNSADAPNSSSTTNNGVYQTGYKITSADKSTVVFTPPANGVRFKFDWKPNDANANVAFTTSSDVSNHIYYLTNGSGNIGTTKLQSVTNNYFNTTLLPPGNYQAMVFAIDTRGNADTVYTPFEISTQDIVAPANPVMRTVLNDSTNRITISWYPNTEPDLKGYRLYSSTNGTSWMLQKNEALLGRTVTKFSFSGITSTSTVYFRLTAVDSAAITNESGPCDMYGLRANLPGQKVLIIDAFDRITGSYNKRYHPFSMTAGQSLNAHFETAHNNAIVDGSVMLANYDAVVWLFGDESSADETFGTAEQTKATEYLNGGGKIFATGSEIAFDLEDPASSSQADRDFFHNRLYAAFAGDNAGIYRIIGSPASFLNGVSFTYGDTLQGSPYTEDNPDYLTGFAGISHTAASYEGGAAAMVAGTNTVLLAIPFETIHAKTDRDAVMTKVLNYLGITTSAAERNDLSIPAGFTLEQNYPNPFNPSTNFRFSIPSKEAVSLMIFDVLGKPVSMLVNEELSAGTYTVQWNAEACASGVYFYRLRTGIFSETKKLVLTK